MPFEFFYQFECNKKEKSLTIITMESTSNVESGDGETSELSSLQENFSQQQVSVCAVNTALSI